MRRGNRTLFHIFLFIYFFLIYFMRPEKSLVRSEAERKLFVLMMSLIFHDALSCWINIMWKGAQGSERSKYSALIPKGAEQILEEKYTWNGNFYQILYKWPVLGKVELLFITEGLWDRLLYFFPKDKYHLLLFIILSFYLT